MMSVFLNIVALSAFMYFLMRKAEKMDLRKVAFPALILKIAAGLLLGIVFKFLYGGGDTFSYYREGLRIADYIRMHPQAVFRVLNHTDQVRDLGITLSFGGQPRALFFSKIVALVHIITHSGYWLMSIYFSLLNFWAALLLVGQLTRRFQDIKTPAVIAFFYFPSIIFWSSGILKESVAISALYFMIVIALKEWSFISLKKVFWLLGFLLAAYFLWRLRYFYLGVLVPLLLAAFAGTWTKRRLAGNSSRKIGSGVIYAFVLIALFVFMSGMHYNLHHDHLIKVLYENYQLFTVKSAPGTSVVFQNLRPDALSFLMYAPKALFAGLFSPNIWDIHDLKQLPQIIENFLLLLITVVSLFYVLRDKPRLSYWALSALIYVVLMSVLLVFASPNYGSLMRYRTGYLSFFVLLIFYHNPVTGLIKKAIPAL
jgi:hypothetical protein